MMNTYKIKFKVLEKAVPDEMVKKWQNIVNILAQIYDVQTGLIMRVHEKDIEVFLRSNMKGNPYRVGDKEHLYGKLYCEKVMNENHLLYVDDALKYKKWKNNPDVSLNMISYLGVPIHWPNGETFGTICVLDSKPVRFSEHYKKLIWALSSIIEDQLKLLFEIEKRKQIEALLRGKNEDLEKFNTALVDREMRLVEIKKEVNNLCVELGHTPKYSEYNQEFK
jgi:transcriptional regulator with GAF, ATPase, and Fis domain